MTAFLVLAGSHLKSFRSMGSVWKQAERTVGLRFHGEFAVQDDAMVAGVVCQCGSEFRGPPGVVPQGGGIPQKSALHLVSVELQAVSLLPDGDAGHAVVEVCPRGGGAFWEREVELGVTT